MNKTKVVCTIGPASIEKDTMKKMVEKGMDVIRINMSYANKNFCDKTIKNIREIEKETNKVIGVLFDTKGPEIKISNSEEKIIKYELGKIVNIYNNDNLITEKIITTDYKDLHKDISIGHHVVLNGGLTILKVIDKYDDIIVCEVEKEGYVEPCSKVYFPDTNLNIPFVSKKDEEDIKYADEMKADFLALSMVNSKDDVLEVNDILIGLNNDHMSIIAKIENFNAIKNIDEIIDVSDGIMIARGDMGAEITMSKVPMIQKQIINKCHDKGKICIVATEMMASMENHLRPTGAEVADVANAVVEATDAVMLSGETTIGEYPIETVDIMNKIIESSEEDINYIELLENSMRNEKQDITSTIAYSSVDSANRLKAKAIVVSTMSGYTARKISRFRPMCPIIVTSPSINVVRSLVLNYGIVPIKTNILKSTDEIIEQAKEIASDILILEKEDKIIITGGFPIKEVNYTNFMKIEKI